MADPVPPNGPDEDVRKVSDGVTERYRNGELSTVEKRDAQGQLSTREYFRGQMKGVTEFYKDDKLTTVEKRDDAGQLVRRRNYGAVNNVENYANGEINTIERNDANGKLVEREYFRGQMEGVTEIYKDGKLTTVERHDQAGELVRRRNYGTVNNVENYVNGQISTIERNDENGKLVEREYFRGQMEGVTEIYKDDKLTTVERRDQAGELVRRRYYEGEMAGTVENYENGRLTTVEKKEASGPMKQQTPNKVLDNITAAAASDPTIVEAFGGREKFDAVVKKIGDLDAEFAKKGGSFFALGATPQESAENFTKIHIEQYREGARPSLPALVAHHLDEIGLKPDNPHYKAALLVAARAEVDLEKTPQYHNKNHYADVTAQVAEFVKKNNELAAKGVAGARLLTPEEMADSITAAVGHDLDHPGGKNATPDQLAKGVEFDRLRLEEQSFKAMEPLLKQSGLDEKAIRDIHTMIQTTSPDGPHDILKAIAKAQQDGTPIDWSKVHPQHEKFEDLKAKLLENPKLTVRAAMLEDADLGASAYEGMKSNIKMSAGFTEEVQERGYRNKAGQLEDLNGPFARSMFDRFVVKGGPASAAAQVALGTNHAEMMSTTTRELQAMTLRNSILEMAKNDPAIIEQFGGQEKFDQTIKKIGTLDTEFAQKNGTFFHLGSSPQESAEAFTKIHVEQYRETGRPSLVSLVAHHLDEIGLANTDPHYKAALLVAARAEVDLAKTPQYHNTNHYADVTAQVAEFVKKNNELAEKGVPGAQKLTPQEMADSITAAVAHDIEHPGGKNILPGEQLNSGNRLRLEEQSFKTIEPLLKEAGLPVKSIEDIHTMIQTTSPDGPHTILKAVAKAQQLNQPIEWEKIDPKNQFPELKELAEKLKQDPKLTARAAMLEDADLGASAFEGKKSNVKMSEVFTQELQERNYNENLKGPSARQGFGDFVVGEGPASAAAQDALGANYKEMYAETRPVANQMKTLAVGTWKEGVMEGGTPFARAEATGLNQFQIDGTMKAMQELGLKPVIETGTEPGKTVFRLEGDDVAKVGQMRKDVIAKMDWKPAMTAEGVVNRVATAPLGNDEIKALNNSLQGEGIAPETRQSTRLGETIRVSGEDAIKVTDMKRPGPNPPPPPAPPKPPSDGGGSGPITPKEPPPPPPAAGGSAAKPPVTTADADGRIPAPVRENAPIVTEKPPTTSKFLPENKGPSATIMDNPRNAGTGNAGAAGLGIVLGGVGLHDAIERGDTTGGVIAGANIATSTVQATEGVLTAVGRTAPLVTKVGKFVPGANLAITALDGAYQISQEKTTEAKVERGVVVGATTATALLAGTATATVAETAAVTTVVTALGGGAATAGTTAVLVAAAPVVLTVAAAGAVAYTGNAALESKRAWDGVDKMIEENGRAQERQGYKSQDGKPSVLGYKHIAVQLLHHSELLKTENMNGVAGMERDKNGRFKIQDFRKIDMRDPKNIAELERVLSAEIAKKDKIIKDNDSIVPKGLRIFSGDFVEKMTNAQMDRADMAGALAEIQMYKKKLQEYDAANPGDPATTGVKPVAPPAATAATKPRAKGPGGMG